MDYPLAIALGGLALALRRDIWNAIASILNIERKGELTLKQVEIIEERMEERFKHAEELRIERARYIEDKWSNIERRIEKMHSDASDKADELQAKLGKIFELVVQLEIKNGLRKTPLLK